MTGLIPLNAMRHVHVSYIFLIVDMFSFQCYRELNFEQALINLGLDTAPIDGKILTTTISTVTTLNLKDQGIKNMTGIQDFTALISLTCATERWL